MEVMNRGVLLNIIKAAVSLLVIMGLGAVAVAATVSLNGDWVREEKILLKSVDALKRQMNWSDRGLLGDIKSPAILPITFLFSHYQRTGDADVLKMATLALDKLKNSAIFAPVDRLHLYATGPKQENLLSEWMIYSNALLGMNYTQGFMITRKSDYKQTAQKIFDYFLSDMQSPGGGFYSCLKGGLPGSDDRDLSIITSWNSLAVSALARAGFSFNEPRYIDCAKKAARFILSSLFDGETLYHSFRNDRQQHPGLLEDYAFFIAACLDLYGATADIFWLKQAIRMDVVCEGKFGDKESGYFFTVPNGYTRQDSGKKPVSGGTQLSGSATAVMNLLRLSMFTHKSEYGHRAEQRLNYFFTLEEPLAEELWGMLLNVELLMGDKLEFVLITPKGDSPSTSALLSVLRKQCYPGTIIIVAEEGDQVNRFAGIIPSLEHRSTINGEATIYLCKNGVCMFPITEPGTLEKVLAKD